MLSKNKKKGENILSDIDKNVRGILLDKAASNFGLDEMTKWGMFWYDRYLHMTEGRMDLKEKFKSEIENNATILKAQGSIYRKQSAIQPSISECWALFLFLC